MSRNKLILIKENDDIIAVEGTLRDVTKLKTAEMEQLEANRRRNMLISYISHELRTPITSMVGYSTALIDGTISRPEEQKEAIDIIASKTLTLKKLIDELDQLTKIETQQFSFDFESYTAAEVTEFLLNNNLADARSAGFEVTTVYNNDALNKHWVIIDINSINKVFSNLMNNSIKYSADIKELFITFSIDDNEENFVVSVKDNGIGIRDDHIPYVFDRFYRAATKNNGMRSIEGSGLGLTLCKYIINAHQGEIYVESIYGSGSTFTFIIPLYKESR